MFLGAESLAWAWSHAVRYTFFAFCAACSVSCGGSKENNTGTEGDSIVSPPVVQGPEDLPVVAVDTVPVAEVRLNDNISAEEFMALSPDSALYARGILPQMARDHEPYARKLLNSSFDKFIIVDKATMHVYLFDKYGRELKKYKMACAKNYGTKHKKADSRTPEGFFSIEGIYDSTDWLFTDDDGVTSKKKGQFGPRFLRLRTPVSMQIGIHGTCAPWSLGARASHGCIRIHNDNILELAEIVTPGMPVIVNPSRRDTAVNLGEDCDIPWISATGKKRYSEPKPIEPDPEPTDSIAADSATVNDSVPMLENHSAVSDTTAARSHDSSLPSRL